MGQLYLPKLYRALFPSAYYGLLRVSELTAGTHPILAVNAHIATDKNNFLFILRTSKTHWLDEKPQLANISSIPTKKGKSAKPYCPFKILQEYLYVRLSCISRPVTFALTCVDENGRHVQYNIPVYLCNWY